jgi:hypothetical protein
LLAHTCAIVPSVKPDRPRLNIPPARISQWSPIGNGPICTISPDRVASSGPAISNAMPIKTRMMQV